MKLYTYNIQIGFTFILSIHRSIYKFKCNNNQNLRLKAGTAGALGKLFPM